MKKNLIKIVTLSLVTVGVIFWGVNYIFFSNRPKSKAAGETINLTFNPASVSNVAVNQDFTVKIVAKPSINALLRGYETRVNFDKSKIVFKSIQYLAGSVSNGIGDTDNNIASINNAGQIKIVGESQASTGYSLTSATGSDLVNLTFTALSDSPTTVTIGNSSFYSINADMSLFSGWAFTQDGLSVNGGTVATSTPIPTLTSIPTTTTAPGEPTSTPVPTLTPIPTATGVPDLTSTPTSTPTPIVTTGSVNLKMKLKFQGINKLPVTGQNSMNVKVKVVNQTNNQALDFLTVPFTSDNNGVWSGQAGFGSNNIFTLTDKYLVLVKGPQHIQKKICDSVPTETAGAGLYGCSNGKITLAVGDNNLDFSGILLLAGDLNQSGIVDSVDFALVRNNLGKTDVATLVKADINLDGKIDTQDFSLIIFALGVKIDEL